MSLNKNKYEEIEITGNVTTGPFSKGSKSEHTAVYIQTENGSFVLRLAGENPFSSPALKKYEGMTVRARGILDGNTFHAKDIKEVKE